MVLEIWKKVGQVEVMRDERGRFVGWHKIVRGIGRKRIAVYGFAMVNGSVSSRKIELIGGGKELCHAVVLARDYPPRRRFITLSAKRFNSNPFRYVGEGYWVHEPNVES